MEVSGEPMNHLKALMPMAQQLLNQRDIDKSDLTAVAASIGPGSFTGIRIGVSSARAIAQALDIPAISVPTLETFKLYCNGTALVAPIINARRGQVYGGVFGEDGADILAGGPYMLTDVFAAIKGELACRRSETSCGMLSGGTIKFYGDGIDAYGQMLETFTSEIGDAFPGWQVTLAEEEKRYQTAEMTARMALMAYEEGHTLTPEALLPDYMRATEAEQKLKDGTLAKERAAKMARFMAK
jgi:tRNA threonylcarbamoyladenosine biosynthesis protein TsaB